MFRPQVVWFPAAQASERALAESSAWLDADERARAARFATLAAARDFVAGRWLLRKELARWTAIPPAAWRFELDDHGRPRPVPPEPTQVAPPSINLSHGGGLIAVASCAGGVIGVDVEDVGRALPSRRLERFLAREEYSDLERLDGRARLDRFWRTWTLKEAYLKARGTGIAGSLSSFAIGFDAADRPRFLRRDGADGDDVQWRLFECRPTETTRLGIACSGTGLAEGEPVLRRCDEALS
ncbi:MAG: 4'-phosphopantetheinyl transferase superfamily protein [Planctomycetes bacterium]|nr:4'-phosphopantetheinyl transferase superfamily protein [Planctomycetota bacterium]